VKKQLKASSAVFPLGEAPATSADAAEAGEGASAPAAPRARPRGKANMHSLDHAASQVVPDAVVATGIAPIGPMM
jgi:hypothetical protein